MTEKQSRLIDESAATKAIDSISYIEQAENKRLDVFVIGCGTVGGALIEQIKQQQSILSDQHQLDVRVFGIATSATFLLQTEGINLAGWKAALSGSTGYYDSNKLLSFIEQHKLTHPVVVDCTGSRSIALEYEQLLANGVHIVTANKIANGEPLDYYRRIREIARKNSLHFFYETNIGAGLPVIEPLQKLLKAGDQLNRFEGILSGSLSYIFGELHNGLSLSEATQKARSLGYTEPDPREDLNGMDVARKVLIIAREIGLPINIEDVEVESVLPAEYASIASTDAFLQQLPALDQVFARRIEEAEKNQQVLRYVATMIDGKCKVSIENIDQSNPLYSIKDGENVLAFYSRYYNPKPLVIRGYGAGPEVTAAGVFSDLLRLVD